MLPADKRKLNKMCQILSRRRSPVSVANLFLRIWYAYTCGSGSCGQERSSKVSGHHTNPEQQGEVAMVRDSVPGALGEYANIG